jgi:Spy/CpxP family protein refolding chaperone
MKKLFLMLALIAGLGFATTAQTKTPLTPQQKADRATKALKKQLSLTDKQAKKVDAIYITRATELDSLKAQAGKKGNGKKKKAIAEDTQAQINAVLTPAQQQQFAQIKEMKKQKMQANRKMKKDSTAKTM